jgi:hypothetical protein
MRFEVLLVLGKMLWWNGVWVCGSGSLKVSNFDFLDSECAVAS